MGLIYKTLTTGNNPDAEYQYRGSNGWYKRKRGSNEAWYRVQSDKVKILENDFKQHSAFFNYSATAKIGVVLLLGVGAYLIYSRFYKK